MWWTIICIVVGSVACTVGLIGGYYLGIKDCADMSEHAYEAGRKAGYGQASTTGMFIAHKLSEKFRTPYKVRGFDSNRGKD